MLRGNAIKSGVKRGRNCRDVRYNNCGLGKVPVPLRLSEEVDGGSEDGLEELRGNADFKESPELRKHEEV